MKKIAFILLAAITLASCGKSGKQHSSVGYPIGQVPFTSVSIDSESFWGQRLKASREVTIPLAFSKCEETERYGNFERAAHPSDTNRPTAFPFDDTDVYKTIEGASYLLQTYPDPKMEAYIDSVLVIVAAAQEPDGYLYTARTQNPAHPHSWSGPERWSEVENGSHEFYNLGHMLEGAVAHYQATGKRNFLDIAIKYADCVCREIGDEDSQVCRVPGHQIAEMGLAKLYLVTGDRKYLDQAKYFLDKRGYTTVRNPYSQSHLPVVDQDEAVGHAVRAEYMYSGMADVAALTGDRSYVAAIDRIWENLVTKKTYITGGVGSSGRNEGFTKNYDLPNLTAYCETCASIGNVYTNYRMFLLHGESKYIDVLERSLYNALIAGISLDGGAFFYPNPLESDGSHLRQPWFGCACCPSNVSRFIPSLAGYIYAAKDKDLYVNLYASSVLNHELEGKDVKIEQKTDYPWSGAVDIRILQNRAGEFTLKLRIPGWAQGEVMPGDLYSFADKKKCAWKVSVNSEEIQSELEDGYFCIRRKWKTGDTVSLEMKMDARTVMANEAVEADRGRLAVERGPLVYCAEWPDNEINVLEATISRNSEFKVEHCPDMLYGIDVIKTGVLTLIPYYAWNHRGAGNMEVWIKENQ